MAWRPSSCAHTCLHSYRNGLQGESSWILRSYWLRTITSLECLYHSPYPRFALQSCPGSFKPLYVIFPYVLHLRLSWQNSTEGCVQSTIQPVDSQKRKVLSLFMSGSPWLVFWQLQIPRDSALFPIYTLAPLHGENFRSFLLFFSPSLFLFISEKRTYPYFHERPHKKTERNIILHLGIFRQNRIPSFPQRDRRKVLSFPFCGPLRPEGHGEEGPYI